jgi:hypothetical protein
VIVPDRITPDLDADRARALKLTPVSRETSARLDEFVEALLEWQRRTNLIASSTIPKLWTRHIADSLQLLSLAPNARRWVDLGSGAGFPGLVIAAALSGEADAARGYPDYQGPRHCPCCANRGFRENIRSPSRRGDGPRPGPT